LKFILFVEGETERIAVPDLMQRWFSARLGNKIGVSPRNLNGWPNFLKDIGEQVKEHHASPKGEKIIACVGLLDLYGPQHQDFFPKHAKTRDERYAAGVKKIEHLVDHPKFHMFFAVHETEAWLLAQPSVFDTNITNALTAKAKDPESVNFDTPPSILLGNLFRKENKKKKYKKVIEAKNRFPKIDPNVVYARCPYFKHMMDKLLDLAQKAGC